MLWFVNNEEAAFFLCLMILLSFDDLYAVAEYLYLDHYLMLKTWQVFITKLSRVRLW